MDIEQRAEQLASALNQGNIHDATEILRLEVYRDTHRTPEATAVIARARELASCGPDKININNGIVTVVDKHNRSEQGFVGKLVSAGCDERSPSPCGKRSGSIYDDEPGYESDEPIHKPTASYDDDESRYTAHHNERVYKPTSTYSRPYESTPQYYRQDRDDAIGGAVGILGGVLAGIILNSIERGDDYGYRGYGRYGGSGYGYGEQYNEYPRQYGGYPGGQHGGYPGQYGGYPGQHGGYPGQYGGYQGQHGGYNGYRDAGGHTGFRGHPGSGGQRSGEHAGFGGHRSSERQREDGHHR